MKTYVKPDLYYENFELSHNVASCSSLYKNDANHSNGNSCTLDAGAGIIVFFDACTSQGYNVGDVFEEYCYQTGSDDMNFFSS